MRYRNIILSAGLSIILSSPSSMAQRVVKKTTTPEDVAATRIEPLRVINGEMHGRSVSGQFSQRSRLTSFTVRFTRAEVVNGRLQLRGDFSVGAGGARLSDQVVATMAGAIADAVNPWPRAADAPRKEARKEEAQKTSEQKQGREAKTPEAAAQLGQLAQSTQDTARKTPSVPAEKTEQTQSLYAQSDGVAGCGAMFLKLVLPQRLRARMGASQGSIQVGVVLKAIDNERGQETYNQICRVSQPFDTRDQAASLDRLNRLLSAN